MIRIEDKRDRFIIFKILRNKKLVYPLAPVLFFGAFIICSILLSTNIRIANDYTDYNKGKYIQIGRNSVRLYVYKDRAMLTYPNRYMTVVDFDGTDHGYYSDISRGNYIEGKDFKRLISQLDNGGVILYGSREGKADGEVSIRGGTFRLAYWRIGGSR